jgi:chemotaxis protein CheD
MKDTFLVDLAHCELATSGEIVAGNLGAGVVVAVWDPEAKIGGLAHMLLPDSAADMVQSTENPSLFCDTAGPHLLEKAEALGAERTRLRVDLIGGANLLGGADSFDVGRRNQQMAKRAIEGAGLKIRAEDVGGSDSRRVRLNLEDGSVHVRAGLALERTL